MIMRPSRKPTSRAALAGTIRGADNVIAQLRALNKRLVDGLEEYGQHDNDDVNSCQKMSTFAQNKPCTCGFDALIAEAKEAPK